MEENIKLEKVEYLTENFKDGLFRMTDAPTAQQMISMLQFAIESIMATDREGWREGVADGLCRQITKALAVYSAGRITYDKGTWKVIEDIVAQANEHFGIREDIKKVLLDGDYIDLGALTEKIIGYKNDIFQWVSDNYYEVLTKSEKELPF